MYGKYEKLPDFDVFPINIVDFLDGLTYKLSKFSRYDIRFPVAIIASDSSPLVNGGG